MTDADKLLADIAAAGPDGLRVKAGWLVLRPDGDYDLRLDPDAGDDPDGDFADVMGGSSDDVARNALGIDPAGELADLMKWS